MSAKHDDPCSPEAYYLAVNRGIETRIPVVTLDAETSRALKTAGRKVSEWTAERDRLVKDARKKGGSLREIAHLAGLSHQAVKFICEGRPAR